MSQRLYLSPPHLDGNERRYIGEALDSNWITPLGPMVERFEKEFAAVVGIPHCLAVNSGTSAIHLALRVAGIGAGDTVLASTLTFIGGVAPILYQNAAPIFIDSDEATWNMDPKLVADTLTHLKKAGALPKAILPTDIYGQSCDLDALRALADEFKVKLIIDSAESLGATYKQRMAGDAACGACYSFNGNKIITTGGGGMLASHNEEFIKKARSLSQQARMEAAHYEHETFGYNYRLSNISAALGVGQLEKIGERVAKRRAIFAQYEKLLKGLPGLSFMPEAAYGKGNRWLSVMLVDEKQFGADREHIRCRLEKENIESRPVWKPMHLQKVFAKNEIVGGAVAERFFTHGLCLPSGSAMSEKDVERVAGIIASCRA